MSWTDDQLWRDFLAFCGGTEPNEQLLLSYLTCVARERFGPHRMAAATSAHEILHVRMVWLQTRRLRNCVPRRWLDDDKAVVAPAA